MKIVLALGGNAISRENEKGDITDQIRNSRTTAKYIVDLVAAGHKVLTTHGNGPQVGNILRRVESSRKFLYPLTLDICGALTQGGMGYMIQREINNCFRARKMDNVSFTVITQTLVDRKDPAFRKPTKPIGPFLTEKQMRGMAEKEGWETIEDAGRGWRRVVPSPRPVRIIEENEIRSALEFGDVIVCCGGGGVPVVEVNGELSGIEAVIDKDFATSLLARRIGADLLVISTGVEKVALNFNTPEEVPLNIISVLEARNLHEKGEFPEGNMGPKILAAVEFVEATGKDAVITLPEKTIEAIEGKTGTRITA